MRYTETPRLAEDEFTVRQYAGMANLTYNTARRHLGRLVDEGILTEREVLHEERKRLAFRRVDD
jgi:Fic family protein